MTPTSVAFTIGLLAAWLAWPRINEPLLRAGRITPNQATWLVILRTPLVVGVAVLLNGGEPWVVGLVVLATLLGGWLLAPYLRDFLADVPRRDAPTASHDIRER
jgi:hypothetical protein